ncbi:hypothetical protein HYR99_28925 [Candidatus Poribacteria bacterium]|nr:hypothetical protein [Candidatus Poribacteria bacterium]
MPHTVTLTLPEGVYENYQQKAQAINKPVKQVIEEVVCADQPSPPSVDDAPEYLHADLKALEKLSHEELRCLAESHLEPAKQRKLSRLLDKNQTGTITKKEHQQLDELLQEGQRLMVIKAHAWVLLKWRGERIPTYEELRRCSQQEWK